LCNIYIYKFTGKFYSQKILKISEHLEKLQAKAYQQLFDSLTDSLVAKLYGTLHTTKKIIFRN